MMHVTATHVPSSFDPHDIYSPFFCYTIRLMIVDENRMVFRASRGAGVGLVPAMLQTDDNRAKYADLKNAGLTAVEIKRLLPDCLFKRIDYIPSGPRYGYHMKSADYEELKAALDTSPYRFRIVEFQPDETVAPRMTLQQFPEDAPTEQDITASKPLRDMSKNISKRVSKASRERASRKDAVDALPDMLERVDLVYDVINAHVEGSFAFDFKPDYEEQPVRIYIVKPPADTKFYNVVYGNLHEILDKFPADTREDSIKAAWESLDDAERQEYPGLWVKSCAGIYIVPDDIVFQINRAIREIAPHVAIGYKEPHDDAVEFTDEPTTADRERAAQMAKEELRARLKAKKHGAKKNLASDSDANTDINANTDTDTDND